MLANSLIENAAITTLSLRGCKAGAKGGQAFAEALRNNRSLTTLYFFDNEIGDSGTAALAKALKNNQSLTVLSLMGNEITAQGAEALAKALKNNQTLVVIDLSRNEIGNQGAASLAEMLSSNHTLTNLSLRYNKISEPGGEAIIKTLEANQTLTSLNLAENEVNEQIKDRIEGLTIRNYQLRNQAFEAIKVGDLSHLTLLLQQGFPLHSKNHDGNSLLHLSAASGQQAIFDFLTEQGISRYLGNSSQKTALEVARESGYSQLLSLVELAQLAAWKGLNKAIPLKEVTPETIVDLWQMEHPV